MGDRIVFLQEYVDLGKEILEYAAHLHQLVGTDKLTDVGGDKLQIIFS